MTVCHNNGSGLGKAGNGFASEGLAAGFAGWVEGVGGVWEAACAVRGR